MKFQTQYNRHLVKGEVNKLPSRTIPDQTMSIKEIIRRYASGLPIEGQKVPMYDGEDSPLPANWEQLDLSEQQDFLQENRSRINQMQYDLQNPKQEPKKEENGNTNTSDKDQKPKETQQKDETKKSDSGAA